MCYMEKKKCMAYNYGILTEKKLSSNGQLQVPNVQGSLVVIRAAKPKQDRRLGVSVSKKHKTFFIRPWFTLLPSLSGAGCKEWGKVHRFSADVTWSRSRLPKCRQSLRAPSVLFLLLMISFFHDLMTFSTQMEKLLLNKESNTSLFCRYSRTRVHAADNYKTESINKTRCCRFFPGKGKQDRMSVHCCPSRKGPPGPEKVAPWPQCEAFNLPKGPKTAMMTKCSEY